MNERTLVNVISRGVCCGLLGPRGKKVQDRPHRSRLVTNEHLLSVHIAQL